MSKKCGRVGTSRMLERRRSLIQLRLRCGRHPQGWPDGPRVELVVAFFTEIDRLWKMEVIDLVGVNLVEVVSDL